MVSFMNLKGSCPVSRRFHLAGGRRGCRGAPSNKALPYTPGKRTSFGLVMGSWRDLHPHFHLHLISCCVIRLCLTQRQQDPYSHESSHLVFVLYAIPLVWILGPKISSHLRFIVIKTIIILNIILFHIANHEYANLSRDVERVSVCVCVRR